MCIYHSYLACCLHNVLLQHSKLHLHISDNYSILGITESYFKLIQSSLLTMYDFRTNHVLYSFIKFQLPQKHPLQK